MTRLALLAKADVLPLNSALLLVESVAKESDHMTRSRFSEEQIIAISKEQEAGMATAEVCRRQGICSATFYE